MTSPAPDTTPARKYVVVITALDGSENVYGPFSEHRADVCVAALQDLDDVEHARAIPLVSSRELSSDLPDWSRVVA